jgi:uncharacterized protein (TIGR03435 family)
MRNLRMIPTAILLMLCSGAVSGQSAGTGAPTFEVVDAHIRPGRVTQFSFGGGFIGDKFLLRNATMVELIAAAYGVNGDTVIGGPAWLDTDRFDVIAKAPPKTSPEMMRLMLQSALADRFKLTIHSDVRPMPAYVLTIGKGKPKLKESDGTNAAGCEAQRQNPAAGSQQFLEFSCRNITMEAFAQSLHQLAKGYMTKPVVDSTALKGAWDFDVKWMPLAALPYAGQDAVSVFDAMDKQLGLQLELQTSPMPVLVVDSVNEKPTENSPEVAKVFPPAPLREFEVAVIKPSLPDARVRIVTNRLDEIELGGVSLKWLVNFAWGMTIAEPPKWMDSEKFELRAKSPGATWTDAEPLETDDLQRMLRTLLIERFKLVVHTEDRPQDVYALVAERPGDKPKFEKADPTLRAGCKEEPGADGKDPRVTNPIRARLITCRNITMDQFAPRLSGISGGSIAQPVVNATGMEGTWTLTLNFTPGYLMANLAPRAAERAAGDSGGAAVSASEPSGALPIFDALSKQLGLKLEPRKVPRPVLVIDHAEQKPTEN